MCPSVKSCTCSNYTEVDSTTLSQDIAYIGVNKTVVNSTLSNLGKWDVEAVKLLCKGTLVKNFLKLIFYNKL